MMNGVNHKSMNETNKYLLLKHLATRRCLSRLELSELTGLSKMTVTAIVNEYWEQGVVHACGAAGSTGGRRPALLEIAPTALLTLGVSIGRNHLRVGIVNLHAEILESEMVPFSSIHSASALMDSLFYLCDRMMASKYRDRIWGIGVSCAGPLSVRDGAILNPPDFHDIHDVAVVEPLAKRYSLPVYLQNDMCTAALAEMYFGSGRDHASFLYVGVDAGIGGGVVLDGKLYEGSTGLAGIIGHMTVQPGGLPCACGQCGCLEQYASTRAVTRWAREQAGDDTLSWVELANGVESGDPLSVRAIDRMVDYLAVALGNAHTLLNPACILVGGDLYRAKDYVVAGLRERLRSPRLQWLDRRTVEVEASGFTGNASLIGTAALVMERNLRPDGRLTEEGQNGED